MPYKQEENQAVAEVDSNIQEFIALSVLIATSLRKSQHKLRLIKDAYLKFKLKNKKIVTDSMAKLYKTGKKEAYDTIKKPNKRVCISFCIQ